LATDSLGRELSIVGVGGGCPVGTGQRQRSTGAHVRVVVPSGNLREKIKILIFLIIKINFRIRYLTLPAAVPLVAAAGAHELRLVAVAALTLGHVLVVHVVRVVAFVVESGLLGGGLLARGRLVDHQPLALLLLLTFVLRNLHIIN
jgi:hypothetical protein